MSTITEVCCLRPRAPALLPGRGDRAGIAAEDRDLERADVDAQLKGVGRDDAQDLAGLDSLLDGAPLVGEVTAAIAADQFGVAPEAGHGALEIFVEDLNAHA